MSKPTGARRSTFEDKGKGVDMLHALADFIDEYKEDRDITPAIAIDVLMNMFAIMYFTFRDKGEALPLVKGEIHEALEAVLDVQDIHYSGPGTQMRMQ